jgi:hypothetical protein
MFWRELLDCLGTKVRVEGGNLVRKQPHRSKHAHFLIKERGMKALWVLATAACLLVGTAAAQMNQQNPNPSQRERQQENAQERASHINDAVDIVSGPNVERVSRNSAWLTWTTNKEAATRVRYGTEPVEPSQRAYVPGGSREHRVELRNLRPGTKYHYEIETRGGKDRIKGSFDTPR